ncbi:MAG: PilN domain-containing protein [Patescibacteria group bacterium]|nr:PilN domain-containing protein [Patescibacteria group bacterium]
MEPETGQGAATQNQQPAATTAQGRTAPNHGSFGANPKVTDNSFAQFKEHSAFNVPVFLTWVVAVFAIVATLFFWWMNRNLTDELQGKITEKDTVLQQIASQGDTEKKAADFKASVTQLKSAYLDKYNFSTFTTEFYKKVTNDVKLTNMAITSDGTLSISGTTKSYRSVADLMVAMKSWDNLQNVELLTVATSEDQGALETTFSISAKIDKTKQQAAKKSVSSITEFNNLVSGGGSDAKI